MSIVFEVPETVLDENTSQDTLEAWDSLNHMKLIVALEEEFGVHFEEDEILDMKNFKLVRLILLNRLAKV
jgi:acyl carrier protein